MQEDDHSAVAHAPKPSKAYRRFNHHAGKTRRRSDLRPWLTYRHRAGCR
jgi:hypothetical protein